MKQIPKLISPDFDTYGEPLKWAHKVNGINSAGVNQTLSGLSQGTRCPWLMCLSKQWLKTWAVSGLLLDPRSDKYCSFCVDKVDQEWTPPTPVVHNILTPTVLCFGDLVDFNAVLQSLKCHVFIITMEGFVQRVN